jgi:hypothetical protein
MNLENLGLHQFLITEIKCVMNHISSINSEYYYDIEGIMEIINSPTCIDTLRSVLFYVKLFYFCAKNKSGAPRSILLIHLNHMITDTRTIQKFMKSYNDCIYIISVLDGNELEFARIIFDNMQKHSAFFIENSKEGILNLEPTFFI